MLGPPGQLQRQNGIFNPSPAPGGTPSLFGNPAQGSALGA